MSDENNELVDFEVTEEYLEANPSPEVDGVAVNKVGDVIQLPKGLAEEFGWTPPVIPEAPKAKEETPAMEDLRKPHYRGHLVITDGYRDTLEGKRVRHIRIDDGSTYDLTESEYLTEVVLQ